MKKVSIILLSVVIVLSLCFYTNMYFNGGFNEVAISKKDSAVHILQGKWIEGSFLKTSDENAFFALQEQFIEKIGQEKISVFYAINPTKENHETFKVFMGVESTLGQELLSKDFINQKITLKNVVLGYQKATASSQRVHVEMANYAQEKNVQFDKNNVFEQFTKDQFWVEMQLKNKAK